MRSILGLVSLGICLMTIPVSYTQAAPKDAVEWVWDEKSPSSAMLDSKAVTFTITAVGRVHFKKGVVIESVRFLVYYGGQFPNSWEKDPEIMAPAKLGAVTDVKGDKDRSFQTVSCEPLQLEKLPFSVPGSTRLKIVARIKCKLTSTDAKSIEGDFELPGCITSPTK